MSRIPALAGALALFLLLSPEGAGAKTYQHGRSLTSANATKIRVLQRRHDIAVLRGRTWHYQDMRHAKRSDTAYLERRVHALPRLHRLAHYWWRLTMTAQRAFVAYTKAHATTPAGVPPHYSAWMCIHRYEGSWTDTGAPFYGGLQMDWSFMSSYGGELLRSKGTADRWTPLEQMWVAEKAYSSGRGFYPWPNTARACGLI